MSDVMDPAAAAPAHAQTGDAVLSAMRVTAGGLSAAEAARRLQEHGPNALPAVAGRHALIRFLSQFNNALIYFLLAAAVAAVVVGHTIDAAVIVAVVVVNAVVGFVQEGKAEQALEAIRKMISPHANVMRDGERQSIGVADVVVGDIVLLEAGDRVPADIRLLRARGLLIEEAILTGESVAAEKHEQPVPADVPLGDRTSMAYSGTMIAAGQATGVVVATGLRTEIGHISTLLGDVQELTTPLLRQINSFGRRFTWVALLGSVALFAFAVTVRGFDWISALMAVVALSVGVIPEGLPAVITITLAIGVRRMADRHAVIRRLPAVETLGATSVICSDKTGTLTRNEMTARRVVVAQGEIMVSGSGYLPEGQLEFTEGSSGEAGRAAALTLVRAGLLCNDAQLKETESGWIVNGDPMEGALVALAIKTGLVPENMRIEWERIDEIPFDAQHRFMATLSDIPYGDRVILVKGAPERVLEMCQLESHGRETRPLDPATWTGRISSAASQGERVLGFAMKHVPNSTARLGFADVEHDLVFLGIVGFIDPPRAEAIEAIAQCHSAGIAVKMITGDHGATAAAIGRQLGLGDNPNVLTGREIDDLSDQELQPAVQETTIFARTSPEHKLRIVQALQSQGAIVAMTGDGVNDAPSLKQADVGIAMGMKGTEAAKEASQMVLMDDNFASIVAAVHEGRTVYDNIQKVTAWTLPTNGGEALTVISAILIGFTLPMTPAQILWINLITAVSLGLVLAFEPPEPDVMRRPPRRANAGLLSAFLVWRVVFVSLIFLAAALTVFFYAQSKGLDLETARTMVVNTIVILEIFYLFNVRYLHMTSFSWQGAIGTRPVLIAIAVVVVAQLAFTYLPVMQLLFATQPISLADGILILGIGIAVLALLEAEKTIMRRLGFLQTYS
jgi:magnesium-transporting ATPase (P-type)